MSPELATAIDATNLLFKERRRAEDWGRNIIEGSRGLTAVSDWTKYYSYLTNPAAFDPDQELEVMDPNTPLPKLQNGLREVVYKNGTDYTIVVERDGCKDDEKSDL